jgi:hypothetical protein
MKDLVVSCACIALIMALFLQFVANQVIYGRVLAAENAADSFRETVREEGYVSGKTEDELKTEMARATGCAKDRVRLEIRDRKDSPAERGERIYYKITVPLGKILAAPAFWGLSKSENTAVYVIDRFVVSEYEAT